MAQYKMNRENRSDLWNILMVFTLKKAYARNVCDVSQSDTFAYFYAISNFYFLLNISVTHRPRITNTFVLVHPLHYSMVYHLKVLYN